MSYQPTTNGVNYPSPGYNPYYPYPIQPTYPFTPTYTPVRQPNVTPTTYDAPQVGTSAPVPAYTVANPYAGFGYGCCGQTQCCC